LENINDYKRFEYLTHFLCFVVVIFASLVAGYKFDEIIHGNLKESFYANSVLINGTSLSADYNVFAAALILGVISGKYIYDKTKNVFYRFTIIFFQIYILAIVFFSNSRRGVLFIIFAVVLLLTFTFNERNLWKHMKIRMIKNLFIIALPAVLFLFLFNPTSKIVLNNSNTQEIINRINTLTNEKQVVGDRIVRIVFAEDLISSFTFPQLLIGDGFHYLEQYSNHFHTELGADYPHNFLYSTVLYSGIIGLLLIIIFIYKVMRMYLRNFSIMSSFALWFIVLFLFSLTSANTWFSLRLNIILSLLPFLTFTNLKKKFDQTN